MSTDTGWTPEEGLTRERVRKAVEASVVLVALVLIWEWATIAFEILPVILPSPTGVATHIYENFDLLAEHSMTTIIEIFVGYWVGVAVGLVSALLIFYVPFLKRGLYPFLVALNQVPKISFAPMLLVIFGTGLATNTSITAFIVFFPMLVNTLAGFSEVDERIVEMSSLYQVDEWFVLRKIRFPTALPLIMAAMKLSTNLAVVGAVVAEYVASSSGLGFLIIRGTTTLETTEMFAAILYTIIIAAAMYSTVLIIERRILFWYEE